MKWYINSNQFENKMKTRIFKFACYMQNLELALYILQMVFYGLLQVYVYM